MSYFNIRLAAPISLVLLLTACGGGGGGGSNAVTGPSYNGAVTPAAISASNSEPIGTSGTDAASQTVNADSALGSTPFAISGQGGGTIPTAELTQLVRDISQKAVDQNQTGNLPAGITYTADQLNQQSGTSDFCGGSISIPDNTNFNSTTLDVTMTFNNLCYNDSVNMQTITMNGKLRLIDSSTSFTMIYSNFTMTASGDGKTHTINASITCDSTGTSCSSDYVGSDGVTYRVADLSVINNGGGAYNISATFYHPDYGSVNMTTASDLYFACGTGQRQPTAGKLVFTGSNNTAGSIEFLDCSSYQYCYDEDTTVVGESCFPGTW